MRIETAPYSFDALYERILNSRSGDPAIRGKNLRSRITGTTLIEPKRRQITIRHHATDIAVIEDWNGTARVWIDANGYRSSTTKHYLNEILRAYNVDLGITQRDFIWYWTDGTEYEDGTEVWGNI